MKYLSIISVILISFSALSCKKIPAVEVDVPQRIEFTPQVQSKTFISASSDAGFREGFGVFAQKADRTDGSVLSTTKPIMTNYKVKYDNGVWTYNLLEMPEQQDVYWTLGCDHYFLAVFPWASDGSYTFASNTCTFSTVETLNVTIPGTATSYPSGSNVGKDIMYARHEEYYDKDSRPAPIVLNMKHALSAVSFVVRNASENDIEKITNIRLTGLRTKATNLAIPRDKTKEPTMTLDLDSKGTYTFPNADGSTTTPFLKVGDPNFKNLTVPDIIIPQEFAYLDDMALSLTVKFSGIAEAKKLTYKLNKVAVQQDVENKFRYLPGKHYKYKLQILNDYINCEVFVVDWIEDQPIILN